MKFIARFTTFLAFLVLSNVAWAKPATPSITAHPLVWQVDGNGTGKAYMLGSLHLLPPNVEWQNGTLKTMAKNADVYVFEVPTDATAMQEMQKLVQKNGTLPKGQSLSSMLPDKFKPKLDKVLKALHWPEAMIDTHRPWLVSLMIDMAQIQQAKQTIPGPDFVYEREARAAGKKMEYLETIEEQFHMIAPDEPEDELETLEDTLDTFNSSDDERDKLTNAWIAGDADKLASLINAGFDGYPRDKARLFTQRNARWVKRITAMLQTGKTYFIVVGAGHLCGPDGVPALLAKKGFVVSRK